MEKRDKEKSGFNIDISDSDIYEAMRSIPGYLDITPGDFKEIYRLTYSHALKRIAGSVKAGDIMTKKVITVKRATPLAEVAGLMAGKGVSGVPVVEDDGRVAGMISERDFLSRMGAEDTKSFMDVVSKCLSGKGCVALPIRAKNAEDIMTSPAVTVREETALPDIAAIFKEKRINRVPVIDDKGFLSGIVSRDDIVEARLITGLS